MLGRTLIALVALAAVCSALEIPCTFTKSINGKTEVFDLSPLIRRPEDFPKDKQTLEANWRAEEVGYDDNNTRTDYYYYINICHTLVGYNPAVPNAEDATITMLQQEVENVTNSYKVGKLNNTDVTGLRDGDLRLTMGRVNGWYNRDAVIVLFCEDVGLGDPYFVDEDSYGNRGLYNFVWNTCAACPVGSRIRTACPKIAGQASASAAARSKAFGLAIITLLLVEIVAYLILGMAFKRLIKGAKGIEQIPNIDFWRSLFFCKSLGPKPNYGNIQFEEDHPAHVDEEANNDDAMLRP